LIVRCLRVLWLNRRPSRPVWQSLAVGVPIVLIIIMPVSVTAWREMPQWDEWCLQRQRLLEQLKDQRGKHLVVVRYARSYSEHREWVYNAADLDGVPVVWAHDMGASQNRQLLHYFRGRKAWLLEAQHGAAKLKPYPCDTELHRPRFEVSALRPVSRDNCMKIGVRRQESGVRSQTLSPAS